MLWHYNLTPSFWHITQYHVHGRIKILIAFAITVIGEYIKELARNLKEYVLYKSIGKYNL